MKIKKIIFPVVFCALIVQTACTEKEGIEIKNIPEIEPKLVVESFICPQDTAINVYVSRTKPLLGVDNSGGVDYCSELNATVVISNGSNSATLIYDDSTKAYSVKTSLFPIESGITYYITVSTPDGLSADANCTVPQYANNTLEILSYDSSYGYNSMNNYAYFVLLKFNDIPGQENYYRLDGISASFEPRYDSIDSTIHYDVLKYGLAYPPPFDSYKNPASVIPTELISDIDQDGAVINSKLFIRFANPDKKIFFEIYLLTTDINYYKFLNSLYSHQLINDFAITFNNENPVYTNINGGFGVFAAYNKFIIKRIL